MLSERRAAAPALTAPDLSSVKSRGIIRLHSSLMNTNWKHVELLSSVSSAAASPRPGCDDGCSNVG